MERDDKGTIREITKVGTLYDVSPVSFPAYKQTSDLSVAQRKYNFFIEQENTKKEEQDLVKRSLVNLKIKLAKINK